MVRTAAEARDLVVRGGVDVLQCDVLFVGGIGGCRRLAALAELHGAAWSPHTWSNGFGLRRQPARRARLLDRALRRGAATTRRPGRDERRDWLLPEPLEIAADGTIAPPPGPGSRRRARPRRARALAGRDEESRRASCASPGRPVARRGGRARPARRPARCSCASPRPGVCHSDVRLADGELGDGRWPMVLGHEGAGVVEAVGAGVDHVAPGDRVAFSLRPRLRDVPLLPRRAPNLCEPAGALRGSPGTLMDGTSRLRCRTATTLQHGLMTACFAERDRRRRRRRRRRSTADLPALAGGAARLRRRHRRRRRAQRRPRRARRHGLRDRLRRRRPAGGRGRPDRAGAEHRSRSTATPTSSSGRSRAARHDAVDGAAGDAAVAVRALSGGGVDHAFEVVGRPETIRLAWDALRPGGSGGRRRPRAPRRRGLAARDRVPLRQVAARQLLRLRRRRRASCPSWRGSRSRASSTWPGSSRRPRGSTASRRRSSGCGAARARVPWSSSTRRWRESRGALA